MRSRPFFSCRRVLFIFGQLIPPIAFTAGFGLVCSDLWSLEASSNTQLLGTSPQVKIPTKITGRAYKIQVIMNHDNKYVTIIDCRAAMAGKALKA